MLFSGGVIRNKKLQKGTILQLNSHVSKELNKGIYLVKVMKNTIKIHR